MLRTKRKKAAPPPDEPVRINSPSLMERLRAVPVEYDDLFAGDVYRPKRHQKDDEAVAQK